MAVIPKIANMQDMLGIREDTLNAMVREVNKQFEDVVDPNNGFKSIVDTRRFTFTTVNIGPPSDDPSGSTNWADFDLDLDADEAPVRAVVRTFASSTNQGDYERCASVEYNRSTKKLLVDTGNKQSGEVFCEIWKQIKKP